MKLRKTAVALVAGLIAMSSFAGFDQFNGGIPLGYMNTFDAIIETNEFGVITNTANANTGYNGFPYGVPDIQARSGAAVGTVTNRGFVLRPNILAWEEAVADGTPAELIYWTFTQDGGLTPGVDGKRWMDANAYFEYGGADGWIKGNETNAVFTFTVDSYTLDSRYQQDVFLKILDANGGSGGWGFNIGTNVTITAADIGSTITLTLPIPPSTYVGDSIQAGFQMFGLNATGDVWGAVGITADSLAYEALDNEAPTPSPLTFASAPATVSDNKITMTATTATDISGVEYLFTCVNDGSKSSAWQDSATYVADNLLASTLYTFNVQARDKSVSQNTGVASGNASATTLATDNDTPTPNPAELNSGSASSQSIKLTAAPASDASGSLIEYNFECIAGDGVDSGWITTNVYYNTGLASSSNYTWTVTVRDVSAATNTTVASDPLVVTTLPYPGAFALTNTFKTYTGNNNFNSTVHEILLAELAFADYLPGGRLITFDASGATFGGVQAGDGGRNIIRTLGNTHANQSFEAYVTVSGWTPQTPGPDGGHIFMGFGPGDLGAYGVPDWSPNGENTHASFICEITGESAGIWSQTNNSTANWTQDATQALTFDTNNIQRLKLVYNYGTQQGTLSIDQSYDGVTFNAEVVVGPVTVPDFSISPSSIYLGADDGVILSDFEIIGAALPLQDITGFVIVSSDGSTAVLQWSSISTQTYDVEYKTDLGAGSWTADPANTAIPGTGGVISKPSTVAGDEVFYQIKTY